MKRLWLGLAVVVLLFAGLARLRFDVEALHLLPAELPAVHGLQLHQRHFANSRELLVTLQAENPEAATAAAEAVAKALAARTNLVAAARWQPPWLEHPADAAENLAWLWLQQPPDAVAALTERLAPAQLPDRLAETRDALATSLDPQALARASYDPLGLSQLPGPASPGLGLDAGTGVFASADGRFRVVYVEPANPRMNYQQAAGWLAELQRLATDTLGPASPAAATVELAFTGGPAFLAEIATGMERDLRNSVLTTLAVIALLFWLAHRSLRPLLLLVAALGFTLLGTLALGGLLFGTLNVVSAGFAAVMLGLAVDYGLVGYQEARAHPGEAVASLRRRIAQGVGWSAATTAATFLLLRFAGLPGLAQLGTLTALGLLLGAVVMLYGFLPLAAKHLATAPASAPHPAPPVTPIRSARTLWLTAGVVLFCVGTLAWRGLPPATASSEPLRPRNSPAYAAMDRFKRELGRTNDPVWLLFQGRNPAEVAAQMEQSSATLTAAQAEHHVRDFQLPAAFWPRAENAAANLGSLRELAGQAARLRTAGLAAGFTTNSLALAEAVLAAWQRWSQPGAQPPLWPTNATATWLTRQFSAQTPSGDYLALGLVTPAVPGAPLPALPAGVIVTSWDRLGGDLLQRVAHRVGWLTAALAALMTACLWFAFGRLREVLLSLAGLALSFLLLLTAMRWLGASWNLLNLVALPLLLGSSVDSTIHVQLALRRTGADRRALWRTIGRALLLCAGANIAGFGSLAWSNNAGLASLDLVCAGGVACVFVVALGLLPGWWLAFVGPTSPVPTANPAAVPSTLYRASWWRAAGGLVRLLPRSVCHTLARGLAALYRTLQPARRAIVEENLLPLVDGDRAQARRLARENFAEFAVKLVDLWRFEAGVNVGPLVEPGSGWEAFHAAVASGRGVLLVTPHLGNWEFGAPLLQKFGLRPLVLTAPEPGTDFTALRAAARARHGIETLVVGTDPFAFLEVIKRLQAGGVVALLVDRPPPATAVEVEFCGRPFAASVAAAELARATGCVVLPVFVVREAGVYRAHALPPLDYDRRTLGTRAARCDFAGRILRTFEPSIRRFAGQWFHFVPVWPQPPATTRDSASNS